jgi:hypothetical protein
MAWKSIYLSIQKKDKIFQYTYWLLVGIIISFNSFTAISNAQANIVSIDSNISKQPLVIKGTSGGTVIAKEITQTENTATGYCHGYVRSQPNHVLKLESFFESLRLEVESSADTTILVKGPGGVWCNDDASSANPMIEGQWQPGTY